MPANAGMALFFLQKFCILYFAAKKILPDFSPAQLTELEMTKMYIKISKEVEKQYRKEVEQIINNKDFQKLRYKQ